jgi:4-alpha-glucanotransferase
VADRADDRLRDVTELPPRLAELAAAHGVATDFWDWRGTYAAVGEDTVVAVLAALGVDASTPAAIEQALEEQRLARWRRMLPPCLVLRPWWANRVYVHGPHGAPVEVWVELEDGGQRELSQVEHFVDPVDVDGVLVGEAAFAIPEDLPLGWHRLHARSIDDAASTPLVITPPYLGMPAHVGRQWGMTVQLYALRSRRSWGLGDLADLADLAAWTGHEYGAGFVLVNPLHAADPVAPMVPSPYLPSSRRFVNPMYLRVEEVPEYAYLPPADRDAVESLAVGCRTRNGSDELLDRDATWTAKKAALERIYAVPRSPGRQASYAGFRNSQGAGLVDFATYCALAEQYGLPWQDWPDELRTGSGPALDEARRELAERIDFYCWLQWVADEQLARVHAQAHGASMPLGVMHDLAVGVSMKGADAWTLQDVLAPGVTVGAPGDAFNQQGQDWNQPPWHPQRLADVGYAPYRDMVRTILRHAGGLRVDHIVGLFRLWWVPDGFVPAAGTYVRYDHEALIGILALEAYRAGAVVVGEDLGTVEPWVRDYLRARGILGTSILWFERDWDAGGAILDPQRWRELCLASVTTHDLPPTAGYLTGAHIDLRDKLGLLTRSVEEERAVDEEERRQWIAYLRDSGLLTGDGGEQDIVEALHRFVTRTSSRLVAVALPDALGDRRVINQPGTDQEYPNWRMPLADASGTPVLLDDLVGAERVRRLARIVDEGTRVD